MMTKDNMMMSIGNFDNDYMAGAHPEVLRALVETNLERTHGYGDDPYTRAAQDLIRQACNLTEILSQKVCLNKT